MMFKWLKLLRKWQNIKLIKYHKPDGSYMYNLVKGNRVHTDCSYLEQGGYHYIWNMYRKEFKYRLGTIEVKDSYLLMAERQPRPNLDHIPL